MSVLRARHLGGEGRIRDPCGECGWEDDGQDDHDADVVRGGPNGRQSLTDARAAYASEGAPRCRIDRRLIRRSSGSLQRRWGRDWKPTL